MHSDKSRRLEFRLNCNENGYKMKMEVKDNDDDVWMLKDKKIRNWLNFENEQI